MTETATPDIVDPEEEARARAQVEAALDAALRRFYEKVRDDALIGPVFAGVVHDWEAHIGAMRDFWSRALLGTERYTRQPFLPHVPLRLGPEHFARWVELWRAAARETMPPRLAEHVAAMGENMSHCWGRALMGMREQA
ncbi:MAG TPA: group III truncated hemoglobin [Beijerinckiaceae bacterium]|jgi:hemoglobin